MAAEKPTTVLGRLSGRVLVALVQVTRRRRDVMLVADRTVLSVRPVVLYRDVPSAWTPADAARYLAERDADKFARAGGVEWLV